MTGPVDQMRVRGWVTKQTHSNFRYIRMSENIQKLENKLRKIKEKIPSPQKCIQSHLLVMAAVDGPFHLPSDECGGLYS